MIMQVDLSRIHLGDQDSMHWEISKSGICLCSSAWNEVRAKHDECLGGNWCGILLPFLNIHLFAG